jgi:hypothetical protein
MLNNITNFFNLIKTGKVKTQLDATDLLPIGTKDLRFIGQYQPTMIQYSDLVAGLVGGSNGQVLFNDNDTIAGAANLYWDKLNERVGIGTPIPSYKLDVNGAGRIGGIVLQDNASDNRIIASASYLFLIGGGAILQMNNEGFTTGQYNSTAKFDIKGKGITSSTTALSVQNSAGANSLQITDDQVVRGYSGTSLRFKLGAVGGGQGVSTRDGEFSVGYTDTNNSSGLRFLAIGTGASYIDGWTEGSAKTQNYPLFIGSRANNTGGSTTGSTTQENGTQVIFGYAVNEASSLVTINSTTRGFLPPRMTTTQKNAIASPAAGLTVYDSTTNKLCCYNGSTWNDLF